MHLIPMALTVGGGLLKARSQNSAGNQQRGALYGQAQETDATAAMQELRLRDAAGKTIGEQRAAQAGNGFAGDSGSALDALRESQVNMAVDVLQLRRDATLRAKAMREEGDQRRAEGRMGAVATLLGTAASAWQMKGDWASARQANGPRAVPGTMNAAIGGGMQRFKFEQSFGGGI